MSARIVETVECDDCGKQVRLRADDAVPPHHWTTRGVRHQCPRSGKPYSRHAGTFRVISRGPDGVATQWIAECRCEQSWVGPDYREVERQWAEHNAAAAGGTGATT